MADIITYIRLHREWVFLAVILDAFSRKVVGWELERTLAARLPIAALEETAAERKPPRRAWCIIPIVASNMHPAPMSGCCESTA